MSSATAQPAPASRSGPLGALWRHRMLLGRTIPDSIRKRYAGQVAGLFWLVLSPLLLMSLYAAIYILVFRIRPVSMSQLDYVLYIMAGLLPFLGFAEALNSGSASLSTDRTVLLNTVFPPELLPFQSVVASHATTAVGMVVLVAISSALGKANAALLLVPVALVLQMLFVTGVVWVLSLASLVLRDIPQILSFLVMALLVATPIAYTQDMIPKALSVVLYANPLSYFVIVFHDAIALERFPDWRIGVTAAVIAVVSFVSGYRIFQRVKQVFFDYA